MHTFYGRFFINKKFRVDGRGDTGIDLAKINGNTLRNEKIICRRLLIPRHGDVTYSQSHLLTVTDRLVMDTARLTYEEFEQ